MLENGEGMAIEGRAAANNLLAEIDIATREFRELVQKARSALGRVWDYADSFASGLDERGRADEFSLKERLEEHGRVYRLSIAMHRHPRELVFEYRRDAHGIWVSEDTYNDLANGLAGVGAESHGHRRKLPEDSAGRIMTALDAFLRRRLL